MKKIFLIFLLIFNLSIKANESEINTEKYFSFGYENMDIILNNIFVEYKFNYIKLGVFAGTFWGEANIVGAFSKIYFGKSENTLFGLQFGYAYLNHNNFYGTLDIEFVKKSYYISGGFGLAYLYFSRACSCGGCTGGPTLLPVFTLKIGLKN